jgi:clusterin-associated protein 1
MSDDISTEAERVKFLQTAAQIMLAKARMKLNLKRLYAADGTAVRELLKLAELLHRATQTTSSNDEVWQCTSPQCTNRQPALASS